MTRWWEMWAGLGGMSLGAAKLYSRRMLWQYFQVKILCFEGMWIFQSREKEDFYKERRHFSWKSSWMQKLMEFSSKAPFPPSTASPVQCQHKLPAAPDLQFIFNYCGPAVRINVLRTLLPCRKCVLKQQTRLDDEIFNILIARDEKEWGDGQRKAARLSETRW